MHMHDFLLFAVSYSFCNDFVHMSDVLCDHLLCRHNQEPK